MEKEVGGKMRLRVGNKQEKEEFDLDSPNSRYTDLNEHMFGDTEIPAKIEVKNLVGLVVDLMGPKDGYWARQARSTSAKTLFLLFIFFYSFPVFLITLDPELGIESNQF